jgi:hypothetical protein
MVLVFSLRDSGSIQVPEHHEIPRSTIAYISVGAAIGLVLFGILFGWLLRLSRRKRRIRERRKTRQARREKLQTLDTKNDYQHAYSMKTMVSKSSNTPTNYRQPAPQRWKWNPPGDPEKTAAAIQIPPNVKFF